ncbi:hypothetical protein ABG067_002658 [Albugo candida]
MPCFPLPANYFASMTMSEKEVNALHKWSEYILQRTLKEYHRDETATDQDREQRWKTIKQRGNLTTYRMRSMSFVEPTKSQYLCYGTIQGTLDQVMFGRYAATTESFRRLNAIYRDDLVDCAVLHVIEGQSKKRPFYFSGIKWACVRCPGKGFIRNRDCCYYEQSGIVLDDNGDELGYTITESIDTPNCPPFNPSISIRANVSACYLYREKKNTSVQVYMRGDIFAKGRVMNWIATMKSAELCLRIDGANLCAQALIATELVQAVKASKRKSPRPTESDQCKICNEKATKRYCQVCHRRICHRCGASVRILAPIECFTQEKRETFCKGCTRLLQVKNFRDSRWTKTLHECLHFAPEIESSLSRVLVARC